VSGSVDPENPDSKEWAARRLAEALSLEEEGKRAQEAPPDELKEIFRVLDYDVAPILDASGVTITREELEKMFAEWYVGRKAESAWPVQSASDGVEYEEGTGPRQAPASFPARLLHRLRLPLRKTMRFVGIMIMLVPLILVPAYFFVSTNLPPPHHGLASGVMTLAPTTPMIAPGQIQNYSALTVIQPNIGTALPTTLTAFAPEGLSFDISQTYVPPQNTLAIPVVIRASLSLAPGTYQVTVEEQEGSSLKNQTFPVTVVSAFVVMEHLTFVPADLNVTKGTTVYWMNLDSNIGCCDPGYHNVAFHSGVNTTSPILKRLDTWSYTFDTPGAYFYYCSIHPFMAAEVNVAP